MFHFHDYGRKGSLGVFFCIWIAGLSGSWVSNTSMYIFSMYQVDIVPYESIPVDIGQFSTSNEEVLQKKTSLVGCTGQMLVKVWFMNQKLGTHCFWSIGLGGGLLPGWVTAMICLIFPSVCTGLHCFFFLMLYDLSMYLHIHEFDAPNCTRVN